jgi:hypothetical protein
MLICTHIWAAEPLAQIENFNANYNEPSGEGSVDYLKIKESYDFKNKTEFSLEKQASKIVLSLPQEDIEIEGIPEFIHRLKQLNIVKLQSMVKENLINLSFVKFDGKTQDVSLNINGFDLSCFNEVIGEDLLLDNCINGASSLEVDYFVYKTDKEANIKKLSLNIKNNNFSIYLKTKGQNIKASGLIEFDKKEMQVVIKINKIKAGFINVKGMVFKELRKIESDKVTVNNPWITINLN